jgi:hypothetical protein
MGDTQVVMQGASAKDTFSAFCAWAEHTRVVLIYIPHLPLSSVLTGMSQTESVSGLCQRGTPVLRFLSFLCEDMYIKSGSLYSVSIERGPPS